MLELCRIMITEEDIVGRNCKSCEDKYKGGKSSVGGPSDDEENGRWFER